MTTTLKTIVLELSGEVAAGLSAHVGSLVPESTVTPSPGSGGKLNSVNDLAEVFLRVTANDLSDVAKGARRGVGFAMRA